MFVSKMAKRTWKSLQKLRTVFGTVIVFNYVTNKSAPYYNTLIIFNILCMLSVIILVRFLLTLFAVFAVFHKQSLLNYPHKKKKKREVFSTIVNNIFPGNRSKNLQITQQKKSPGNPEGGSFCFEKVLSRWGCAMHWLYRTRIFLQELKKLAADLTIKSWQNIF